MIQLEKFRDMKGVPRDLSKADGINIYLPFKFLVILKTT